MMTKKCDICSNFLHGIDRCKFCNFEFDESLPWTDDSEWDILNLDFDETEWPHLQLMYRLKAKGIDCLFAVIVPQYLTKPSNPDGYDYDAVLSHPNVWTIYRWNVGNYYLAI